jgi:hypothetical protein
MKVPIILITVYRRYHELQNNLLAIDEFERQLGYRPKVIIVWAAPDIGRMWFFQKLIKERKVTHVIYRPRNESDDGPTTYSESININFGLSWIKRCYASNHYVIFHAADILVYPKTYELINREMQSGKDAVLFYWQNCVNAQNAWHTNMFAVSFNEDYWPPISSKENHDTLEIQWGQQLRFKQLRNVLETHNSRELKFKHSHDSEHCVAFPVYWQPYTNSVFVISYGRWTFKQRLINLYRRIKSWLK